MRATHAECGYFVPRESGHDAPAIALLNYGRCIFARELPVKPMWLGDTALVPGAVEVECAAFVRRTDEVTP
jgi:hypothetical protein